MHGHDKSKSPRNAALILDILHIIIGLLVVVLGAFAFLNPDSNRFLFPLIFFLAAILNAVNGTYRVRESGRDKKKRVGGILLLVIAGVLLGLSVLSAISIWR